MAEWIKNASEIGPGDPTVAQAGSVSDAKRDEFWNSMISTSNDPFFDVTVSDGQVS